MGGHPTEFDRWFTTTQVGRHTISNGWVTQPDGSKVQMEQRKPILDQGERDAPYFECCESWGGHSEGCLGDVD